MMTSPARRPETIQKIGTAPYAAFAMIAGMQLELFTPLGAGPMRAEQLAEALGVGAAKLTPLLYALVAAGLLTVHAGCFANTPEADTFLVRGKPTYLGGQHAYYTARYQEILQTAASIRTGRPQAKLDFAAMSSEALETFLRGLHPGTLAAGRDLVTRYDFTAHHHLLDVGGGAGGLALAIAAACPQLRATVIDLPTVTPVTQRCIAEEGLSERVAVVTGDVVRRPLRGTYDVAVMRALLQVLAPEEAQRVLHNLVQVLEPGSPIYILGNILDDSRLSPPETVTMNLLFLNIYDEGQAYTEQEYYTWLTAAGFTGMARVSLTGTASLITAYKPT
jgi:ubiquinone/menaquinone biosynthesis C-methylase UbiE